MRSKIIQYHLKSKKSVTKSQVKSQKRQARLKAIRYMLWISNFHVRISPRAIHRSLLRVLLRECMSPPRRAKAAS